jgi:energy-coupling factor transporter ATP-binding protein EcfA2
VLELRSVGYRYPGYGRPALEGIDLTVDDGEIVGLVGANEAGKSTLCLVASGLAPASIGGALTGEVLVDGVSASGLRAHEVAGRVGIVFASPSNQLSGISGTVFEEVALGPVNLGLPVAATVATTRAALEALDIADLAERRPDQLSGGQSQLVAIASVLAMGPRHLVLDEPTAELDPEGRELVSEALRGLAGRGTSVLIAAHDLDLLASVCSRLVAIDGGRLAFDLPIAEGLRDARLLELGVAREAIPA